MSRAVIAGNPVFFVPSGALLELCRSRGALSQIKCYPDDWQHREKKTEIDHLPQAKKCTEIIAHCSERDN
jgi:hypothetical protein